MCVKRAAAAAEDAGTRAIRSARARYRQFSPRTMEDRVTCTLERCRPSTAKRCAPAERLTDIAAKPARTEVSDILSKHVSESTQILLNNYTAVEAVH